MTIKKLLYQTLIALALPLWGLGGSACSEKDEVGEYDNWQARNQHFVDSIAALANAGKDGWTKTLAFNLVDSEANPDQNVNHYIYIQKLENGTGTQNPEYKDSIRVHYLGRMIPSTSHPQGYIFGKSYSTYTFNEDTDVPVLMSVSQNVTGFATAVMHMVEGDRWKLVIPYYLGYGEDEYTSAGIPGYSALIFDVKLARLYKYKIDTDTTWH
ncbi:MAG: FKBP-type peptidyl-prolyl cis-trans isomerase [Bacteroidaceae bacterium]|nr:FKBP-type peptidyl-prolyl cis-trans isomerase [Bacteroidaceae bacterium]